MHLPAGNTTSEAVFSGLPEVERVRLRQWNSHMTAGLAILLRTEDMDLQIWNVRWGDGLRGQWDRPLSLLLMKRTVNQLHLLHTDVRVSTEQSWPYTLEQLEQNNLLHVTTAGSNSRKWFFSKVLNCMEFRQILISSRGNCIGGEKSLHPSV